MQLLFFPILSVVLISCLFIFVSFCCIGGLLVICLSRMSISVSVVVFPQVILLSFLLDFSCFSSSLGSVIKCYTIACLPHLMCKQEPMVQTFVIGEWLHLHFTVPYKKYKGAVNSNVHSRNHIKICCPCLILVPRAVILLASSTDRELWQSSGFLRGLRN